MYQKIISGHVSKGKVSTSVKENGIIELFLQAKHEQLHEACMQMTEPVLEQLPACKSDYDAELLIERHIDNVGRLYWQLSLSAWLHSYLTMRNSDTEPDFDLRQQLCDGFDAARLKLIEQVREYQLQGEDPMHFNTLFDKFSRNLYDEIHRISLSAAMRSITDNAGNNIHKSSDNDLFYRFVTSGNACPICAALNEQIFSFRQIQEGINFPPLHPNCACDIRSVDGNLRLSYSAADLARMLNRLDFKSSSSLIIGMRWAETENGRRVHYAGDEIILSSEDYKTMLALDNLYRAFMLTGDSLRADAAKYQMVKIRQKEMYRGRYAQSDAAGVFLDLYHYTNPNAAKDFYFVLEYLDEKKLMKHGGEGTATQQTLFSIMSAMTSLPEKTPSKITRWALFLIASLSNKGISDPDPREWGVADYISQLNKFCDQWFPDYNPGKVLQSGDVFVYMAPNEKESAYGTEYFFRERDFLYSQKQTDNKVHRGN